MQNDKIKEYWEGEAGIYSEGIKAELQSETAENWKNLILEYAPEKEHLEVLDVGCGPGFFEITLGKEGHHVTGIDITENMIHEAKENVKAAGLSADLMTMDCHNLNFPDETFDMVICRNITWTLDDPQKAYREWLRVLKKVDAFWCRMPAGICIFMMKKRKRFMKHMMLLCGKNMEEVSMLMKMWKQGKNLAPSCL